VKKEFLEAKTAKGASGDLADEAAIKILQKMIKQRRDSAAIYAEQNRPDLAEKETAEAAILESYLPQQLSPEAIEAAIREIIAQTGATSLKDLGRVMAAATQALAGKAEGRLIAATAKRLLEIPA
jgi:uncharacterized protein YqeY